MAVVNKANVPPPSLPKEVVEVPELGGEVIVRGMLLGERVSFYAVTGSRRLAKLLEFCVVDNEGEPIYTEQQWDEFGSRHYTVALDLFQKVRALNGMDAEVSEKKS